METVIILIAVLLVIATIIKAERAMSVMVGFTLSVLLAIYLYMHM